MPADTSRPPDSGALVRVDEGTWRSDGSRVAPWRSAWLAVPSALRVAASWSACLLVVAAAVYVAGMIAVRLAPLTLALAVAALLAGLLSPVTGWLAGRGVPRGFGALAGLLVLFAAVAGPTVLVSRLVADEFSGLGTRLGEGVDRIRTWLAGAGLPISPERLDALFAEAGAGLRDLVPSPAAGAALAAETVAAMVISLVVLFFLLKDGPAMWSWFLRRIPDRIRPRAAEAGQVGWATLTRYVRGTMVVAAIDAVGIGTARWSSCWSSPPAR